MPTQKTIAIFIVLLTILAAIPIAIAATSGGSQNTGSIQGTVYSDENQNKACDQSEAGIAGVIVRSYLRAGDLVSETTTDASGHYAFSLAPGEYTVKFVLPDGYESTTPFTLHASVTSGASTAVDCGMIGSGGDAGQSLVKVPQNRGWAENLSADNSTFGIIPNCTDTEENILKDKETGLLDLAPFADLQNVLPWPVVKSVTPGVIISGTTATFTVKFEYPFPGTTANVADTLPSGFTGATNFKLDGKAITPTIQTSGYVEFDNIPSPSASSPTGVRTITFTATAPKVTSTTSVTDTASAQFFVNGVKYGPQFYYSVKVTVSP